MQTKTLTKLFIALIVLIGIWYFQTNLQQSQSEQVSSWGEFTTTDINPNSVNKITITQGDNTLELTKPETTWLVDGTAADITKVNQLLEVLESPQSEIISQNQDRYQELGISDDQANKLTFWEGDNEKLVLLISNNSASIIRIKDQTDVYRLTNSLNLNTTSSTWIAPPTPTPAPETETPNESSDTPAEPNL